DAGHRLYCPWILAMGDQPAATHEVGALGRAQRGVDRDGCVGFFQGGDESLEIFAKRRDASADVGAGRKPVNPVHTRGNWHGYPSRSAAEVSIKEQPPSTAAGT